MSNAENEYWQYGCNLERTYGDLQHQEVIGNLVTEAEYKLFSMLRPKISLDGNQWCVLYGDNLQDGVAGFGKIPYLAILDFNKQFNSNQCA